ncbi:MAG: hypothetical protein P8X61_09835, partial [Limibacillus sp.]
PIGTTIVAAFAAFAAVGAPIGTTIVAAFATIGAAPVRAAAPSIASFTSFTTGIAVLGVRARGFEEVSMIRKIEGNRQGGKAEAQHTGRC